MLTLWTWKVTNLGGSEHWSTFSSTVSILGLHNDFSRKHRSLVVRSRRVCRKIILFSSSFRADTWFWSIHSSHDRIIRVSVRAGCPQGGGWLYSALWIAEFFLSISRHNLNYLKVWGWLSIAIENLDFQLIYFLDFVDSLSYSWEVTGNVPILMWLSRLCYHTPRYTNRSTSSIEPARKALYSDKLWRSSGVSA